MPSYRKLRQFYVKQLRAANPKLTRNEIGQAVSDVLGKLRKHD